ncbi:hypothetical protein [cf. Phormidesmis sp. LEGE 11477]|uniref:hypothetical protein n=1 Tax=cf. Phormidesmis sp. LEGE 11477 TaxID=1828680 RepID=UPI00187E38C3|nr:hypothetical protein [cf. Phormidesmis sp. LEGE 11477]MBE9064324.1 hypothetical protein [cf. Phormidesmis sp. LEGE 11477]
MPDIIFDQQISQTLELSYYKPFARSVLANGTREEVNLLYDQGIVCRPNVVAFHLIIGDAWLTVQQSNQLSYDSNAARALIVPWTVPAEGRVYLCAGHHGYPLDIEAGQYTLLWELRPLTDQELTSEEKYDIFPKKGSEEYIDFFELGRLTFVPSTEAVKPTALVYTKNYSMVKQYTTTSSDGGEKSTVLEYGNKSSVPKDLIVFDEPLIDDTAAKSAAAEAQTERKKPSWQPYLKAGFDYLSLDDAIFGILEREQGKELLVEDFMNELFVEEMPRPDFLQARNRVDNLLMGGVLERRWFSRPIEAGSVRRAYRLLR